MSIGIRLHDTAPGTLAQRAQAARAQGFACVHLALSKVISPDYMDPAAATPGLARHVRHALGGLDIAVLGCYLNLATPDEAAYRQSLAQYVAHLNLCRWMDAGVVGTETGNPNTAYRYDPAASHSEDALSLFIDRLAPVVEAAEKTGATLAIEPVYTHIVSDPTRVRRVLDSVHSPCLKIILDPVNLLHPDNLHRRDALMAEAIDLLGEDTCVLHMKDYVLQGGAMKSVAAGTGQMDYSAIMAYIRARKIHIDITLENTTPDNAQAARAFVQGML